MLAEDAQQHHQTKKAHDGAQKPPQQLVIHGKIINVPVVLQYFTERMYKSSDPAVRNQLRQSFLQPGDATTRGPDAVVMMLRRKVLSLWQSMEPELQLQQASQIPNGIIGGPATQYQPPSSPISIAPGNPGMATDLNTFLADAAELTAVNQMGMQVQVRQNPGFN